MLGGLKGKLYLGIEFISSTFCSSNNQIVTLSADLLRQIAFPNLHCDKWFNPNDWPPLSSSRKSHSINVKRMRSWNATRFQSHPFGFLGKLNWLRRVMQTFLINLFRWICYGQESTVVSLHFIIIRVCKQLV